MNSCSGQVYGKSLSSFPSSWWPLIPDEIFVVALRFRCGIPIVQPLQNCNRCSVKDKNRTCGKVLDIWGDHCVVCQFGGHMFTRHNALNQILADVGRAAGYVALMEQIIPDFGIVSGDVLSGISIHEARLDVELFGHHVAPNRILDGTIHHPATKTMITRASKEVGVAAIEGEKVKAKCYPPINGKAVVGCSMETWGFCGEALDGLLRELSVLATRRQVERRVTPTRWFLKWQTHLSVSVALHVGCCLVDALPMPERYGMTTWSRSVAFDGSDMLDEAFGGDEGESNPFEIVDEPG